MTIARSRIAALSALALLGVASTARALDCPPCGPLYCLDDPAFPPALAAAKAALLADGYPQRLVDLLDQESPCVGCIDTAPSAFHIQIVYQDNSTVSIQWTRRLEKAVRRDAKAKRVKAFNIFNSGHACSCCGQKDWKERADYSATLDINTTLALQYTPSTMGGDPPDLDEPHKEPPTPPQPPDPPPTPRIHAACGACIGLADDRNRIADEVDELARQARRRQWEVDIADGAASNAYLEAVENMSGKKFAPAVQTFVNGRYADLEKARATLADVNKKLADAKSRMADSEKAFLDCEKTACLPKAATAPSSTVKPTKARLSLRVGPSFGVYNQDDQIMISAQGAYAITPNKMGFLVASLDLQFLSDSILVMIPIGFEYLFPIGPPGLFIYPRLSVGYGAQIFAAPGLPSAVVNYGLFIPEFGARYTLPFLDGLLHVGAEPVSFPILFNGSGVGISYRFLVYAGINFK